MYQTRKIAGGTWVNWNAHKQLLDENADLRAKLAEQEKYAELGRLAIKAIDNIDDESPNVCSEPIYDDSESCKTCAWSEFCKLRAELLIGDDSEDNQCQSCHNSLQCLVWAQEGSKAKCDLWDCFKRNYINGNKKIIGAELLANP